MERHCLLDDSDNVLSDWLHVPVITLSQSSSVFDFRPFFKEVSFDELGPENSWALTYKPFVNLQIVGNMCLYLEKKWAVPF